MNLNSWGVVATDPGNKAIHGGFYGPARSRFQELVSEVLGRDIDKAIPRAVSSLLDRLWVGWTPGPGTSCLSADPGDGGSAPQGARDRRELRCPLVITLSIQTLLAESTAYESAYHYFLCHGRFAVPLKKASKNI